MTSAISSSLNPFEGMATDGVLDLLGARVGDRPREVVLVGDHGRAVVELDLCAVQVDPRRTDAALAVGAVAARATVRPRDRPARVRPLPTAAAAATRRRPSRRTRRGRRPTSPAGLADMARRTIVPRHGSAADGQCRVVSLDSRPGRRGIVIAFTSLAVAEFVPGSESVVSTDRPRAAGSAARRTWHRADRCVPATPVTEPCRSGSRAPRPLRRSADRAPGSARMRHAGRGRGVATRSSMSTRPVVSGDRSVPSIEPLVASCIAWRPSRRRREARRVWSTQVRRAIVRSQPRADPSPRNRWIDPIARS